MAHGFEEIVDRIYLAAAEPDGWPSVLQDIGETVAAPLVMLLTMRSDSWVGWTSSIDTPATAEDYMRSDAPARSQTTSRLIQADRPGFISGCDLFTEEEFLADPVMTEYGIPNGFHYGAATAIHIPNGDAIVMHMQRREGMPPLSANDISRLDAFRPHLARAGLLAARWRLERLRAAAEALALVGLPAAVLDYRGRVLFANRLIQEADRWIKWLPQDRLALIDPPANELLSRAVRKLGDHVAQTVRSIPIKASATADAAVVHLVPTTGFARELFGGAFGILVITPVSASSAPASAILAALFDLTPSESKVASAIAAGLSPNQIASRHAVSVETVRAQTKAVFAKTGTNRQAQLAALLAGHPKMPIR